MYPPIVWESSFSVGIKVIDEQHQHLIEIINRLAVELDSHIDSAETLHDYFEECVSYGEYHFQTEETYFSQYDYPERAIHLAAHVSYRETIRVFLLREGDRREVASELLSFLGQWWVNHITGTDQTLRGLAERG